MNHFRSLDGVLFTSFAKYTTFGKDLYADLVSPSLQTNLMVETWPNGPGKMDSSCKGPFQVENIEEIDFSKISAEVDFTTKHDHSKWAISYSAPASRRSRAIENFVCIGDINRMETQKKRGGGTVCFQNKAIDFICTNLIILILRLIFRLVIKYLFWGFRLFYLFALFTITCSKF